MKSKTKRNNSALRIFFVSAVLFAGSAAYARPDFEDKNRLEFYKNGVNSLDPGISLKFVNDKEFIQQLKSRDPQTAAALLSAAEAVNNLASTLDKYDAQDHEKLLSGELAQHLDARTPLSALGLGPEAEKLLDWTAKYRSGYGPERLELIKRAVFSLTTLSEEEKNIWFKTYNPWYGSATWRLLDPAQKTAILAAAENSWSALTIKKRKIQLAEMARSKLFDRLTSTEVITADGDIEGLKKQEIWKRLNGIEDARLKTHLKQLALLEEAKKSGLTQDALKELEGKPAEYQLYLLGQIFDNTPSLGSPEIRLRINAVRESRPGETFKADNYPALSAVIAGALLKEIKDTQAGKIAADFYSKNRLKLKIEHCPGSYGGFDPNSGSIKLSAGLIKQFMRINRFNEAALLKGGAPLEALAKFLGPIFMHEAVHNMQAAQANSSGLYSPYVKEKECDAVFMQALYTLEKSGKDKKFADMLAALRDAVPYIDDTIGLARKIRRDPPSKFREEAKNRYPELPSFESAASKILYACSKELERREKLPKRLQTELEREGVKKESLEDSTVETFAVSAKRLKTSVLKKILDDFMNRKDEIARISRRYETADAGIFKDLPPAPPASIPQPPVPQEDGKR